MTTSIIITFCVLLLIAYTFDLTSSKTRIPPVILLLFLGWIVRQLTDLFGIHLPDFSSILPVFGTIGLILIVLEGSLELVLNRSKIVLIRKSLIGALIPLLALAIVLAFFFHHIGHFSFKDSLINAIPFCVISSAIAISSVRNLPADTREFVIYESSFSDIIGVIFFNFLAINEILNISSFGQFSMQLLVMALISVVATIGLSYLLNKIEHHVKFVPIILLIILIYMISKIYHLPGLIFILLFGMFLGNLDLLKKLKYLEKFNPEKLNKEVIKFRELINESTFLIRALFFILFGYLIETSEVLNLKTLLWALLIVFLIFLFRGIQLRLSKLPMNPLLFVAPRGLITILLFLSIGPSHTISVVNNSLVIQVIIITAFLMMFGLMTNKTRQ